MPETQSSTAPQSFDPGAAAWQEGYSLSEEERGRLLATFDKILASVYSDDRRLADETRSAPSLADPAESETKAMKSPNDSLAVAGFLNEVYQLGLRDEFKANDAIYDFMDDRLLDGSFSTCIAVFREVKPERLPPSCIISLLVITRRAKGRLGPARAEFIERATPVLADKEGPEEAKRLLTAYA